MMVIEGGVFKSMDGIPQNEIVLHRPRGLAQWSRHLPGKHKSVSLIPSTKGGKKNARKTEIFLLIKDTLGTALSVIQSEDTPRKCHLGFRICANFQQTLSLLFLEFSVSKL